MAAITAVAMKPISTARGLWPLEPADDERAAARSSAPKRNVMPAVTPARIPVAWPAHDLPTAALAVMTSGSGKSTKRAADASRKISRSARLGALRRKRRRTGRRLPMWLGHDVEDRSDQVDGDRE